MKKNLSIKYISCVIGIALCISVVSIPLISFHVARAADVPNKYTLLEPLPCTGDLTTNTGITCNPDNTVTNIDIKGYIQYMFNLFIAVAAVTAVFMIVFGGFEYMTTDAVQNKSDGLKKVQNAIYGLLLILCSYLILKTVNPQFVAIPDTLVEPMNLKATSTVSALFDKLTQQANEAKITKSEALNNLNADKESLQKLQSDYDSLQSQLEKSDNMTDEEKAMVQENQAKLIDDMNKINAKAVVDLGTAQIQNSLIYIPTLRNINEIDGFIENVKSNLNTNLKTLESNGLSDYEITSVAGYTAEQALSDQAQYNIGILTIQKDLQKPDEIISYGGGAGYGAVGGSSKKTSADFINNDVVNGIANQIKDPVLKQKLIDAAKNAKK